MGCPVTPVQAAAVPTLAGKGRSKKGAAAGPSSQPDATASKAAVQLSGLLNTMGRLQLSEVRGRGGGRTEKLTMMFEI